MAVPATSGGLQVGDIIVGVSDTSTDPSEALDTVLFQQKPGDKVTLDVIRNGQQTTVDVTLGERPTTLQYRSQSGRFRLIAPASSYNSGAV